MGLFRCFSFFTEMKLKKKAGEKKSSEENFVSLHAKLQHSASSDIRDSKPTTFDLSLNPRSNVRVMSFESPVKAEVVEADEDKKENENTILPSIMRELSDFDLQSDEDTASEEGYDPTDENHATGESDEQSDLYGQKSADTNHSGLVSYPGIRKTDLLASPMLKRSCSKQIKALRHVKSAASIRTESVNKKINRIQSQWFAFSTESSYARVDAWVKDLEILQPELDDDVLDDNAGSIVVSPSRDAGRPMIRSTSQLAHTNSNLSKEANILVQSLNPTSSVAHISSVGLKAVPVISRFCSLRSVNLSDNFIVTIAPGCLPKSVQTLNLSRNKISTIEGFKELTRLRVLDLSYNCISRIGQGLSSCTRIKELYLAGNKISDMEGLHRLFKLTVLDLSFNKITTTKELGQLVANYNSIRALNLIGNPIQRNIGDEQLKKAVSSLLPKLVYLNKQPLKAQRAAQEISNDSITKAALGNSKKRNTVRRSMKRVGQGGSSSRRLYRNNTSAKSKIRNQTRK